MSKRDPETGLAPPPVGMVPENLSKEEQDQTGPIAYEAAPQVKQTKAQIMEHAMKSITTQHVRDVLDFSKEKTSKKGSKGKSTKRKHTPAQLRVMRNKREVTATKDKLTRNKPKSLDDVRRQSVNNRVEHLRQRMLPVSLHEYIRL